MVGESSTATSLVPSSATGLSPTTWKPAPRRTRPSCTSWPPPSPPSSWTHWPGQRASLLQRLSQDSSTWEMCLTSLFSRVTYKNSVSRRFVRMDVLSGRRFVRTALDVLSGRRFVRTALDVLSGRTCLRRFVRKTFCQDQLRRFVRKTFCQDRFVRHFFQVDRLRRFVRETFCQDRLMGSHILGIS